MSADPRARLREEAERFISDVAELSLLGFDRKDELINRARELRIRLLAASPEAVSLILQCTACGCVFNPEPKKDTCPKCRGLVFTIRGHSEVRDTP